MARTLPPALAMEIRRAIAISRRHVGKRGTDLEVEKWIEVRQPTVYNRWIGWTERLEARLAFIANERRAKGWTSPLSEERRALSARRSDAELRVLEELTLRRHAEHDPALGPAISVSTVPSTKKDEASAYIIADGPVEPAATGNGFRVLIRRRSGDGWPIVETTGPRAKSEEALQATVSVALEAQKRYWAETLQMV